MLQLADERSPELSLFADKRTHIIVSFLTIFHICHFIISRQNERVIMDMDFSITDVLSSSQITSQVENVLELLPSNPLSDPVERTWVYVTDNYTKLQIAIYGSFIVHEVIIKQS